MRIAEPACCPLWQGLESCYSLKKAVQLIEISRDSRSRMPENQATGLGRYAGPLWNRDCNEHGYESGTQPQSLAYQGKLPTTIIEPDIYSVLGNVFLGDRDSLATFRDLEITNVRIG